MPASGKSSNRRSEQHRGYNGGGHGIYARQGADERREHDRQKQQERKTRVQQKMTKPVKVKKPKNSNKTFEFSHEETVELSLPSVVKVVKSVALVTLGVTLHKVFSTKR